MSIPLNLQTGSTLSKLRNFGGGGFYHLKPPLGMSLHTHTHTHTATPSLNHSSFSMSLSPILTCRFQASAHCSFYFKLFPSSYFLKEFPKKIYGLVHKLL